MGDDATTTDTRRRLGAALSRRFGIDTRALAVLRICLGVLLLTDLALRARYLTTFYTDHGALPRATLSETYPVYHRFSLHALSGEPWVQALLFLVAAVFALALLLGYRTRLATVVSLVLLLSLHYRNPFVLNGGDLVLRRLVFWSVFLPLGERWSVDAVRRDTADPDRQVRERVASVASAALLCQVLLVYGANALLKSRGERWLAGEAVPMVFSLDQFLVGIGPLLAELPAVLTIMNYVWVALLVCSPLLVLATGRIRAILALAFAGMHFGMFLTMTLGLFPLVSMAALVPFLPPAVWDRLPTSDHAVFARVSERLPRLPRSVPERVAGLAAWGRRAVPVVVSLLLAGMLVWNAVAFGVVAAPAETPDHLSNSRWNMFAPEPLSTDTWHVFPGTLESGERVDAFRGGDPVWNPPDVSATYPDARWRKYLTSQYFGDDSTRREQFAGHLCRQWNATHDDGLRSVRVTVVRQPTRLDGPEPTERQQVGNYTCTGSGARPV
ncbi:HTTM domain-containing protein [Haloarchaeobius sp. DFWS5]|uniref:HTTM domain-containing protein n=1 Tax=Haloarchaeobius sp. DFWS5 TaxID=3446114 RepID=UPI003EBDEE29